jgi:hypothetical protein
MFALCLAVAFAADPSPEPEPKETREQLEKRLIELPARAMKAAKSDSDLMDRLFKGFLNRGPKEEEQRRVLAHFDRKKDRRIVCEDLCWSLVLSNELAVVHKMTIPEARALAERVMHGWSARRK